MDKKTSPESTNFSRIFSLLAGIFSLLAISCSSNNDDLGSGYYYHNDGGRAKSIIKKELKRGICGEIIAYDYNHDFIVAAQRPYENYCPYDSYVEDFANGMDTTYFWLIVKNEDMILGPYELSKFKEITEKYQVPLGLPLIAANRRLDQ